VSVEAYVKHAGTLLALSGEADGRLRRQQADAERTAKQAAAQLERERRELTELRTRLEALLLTAREQHVRMEVVPATEVDPGSNPLDLLRQLVSRLEDALADAAHARRALDAQRAREQELTRAREQEARRRREQQELERQLAAQREQRLGYGLMAGGALAGVGAVASFATGAIVVGVPVATLALTALGIAGWRRRHTR
jgi:chromosome segregation ATPase